MPIPADAGDQAQAIEEAVKATMRHVAAQKGLRWVAVTTGEMEPGEVFECRIRFGWDEMRPGDDRWPYTSRSNRGASTPKTNGLWTPGRVSRHLLN